MIGEIDMDQILKDIVRFEEFRIPNEKEPKKMTELLKSVKIVLFYWGANWCKVCQYFGPKLIDFYQKINIPGKDKVMEVLYYSFDKEETEFEKSCKENPWLHFSLRNEKAEMMRERLEVHGIPFVTVFKWENSKLKLITKNGRMDIQRVKEKAFDLWLEGKTTEEDDFKIEEKKPEKVEEKKLENIEEKKEAKGPN